MDTKTDLEVQLLLDPLPAEGGQETVLAESLQARHS